MLKIATCWPGMDLRSVDDQRGASAVEYALLIAMIAAVIALSVSLFGLSVADLFQVDFTP